MSKASDSDISSKRGSARAEFSGEPSTKPVTNVAVVIPCFNVEKFIENVIAEIGPEVKNIICVDDCSTDNTKSKIEDLAKTNKRVVLVSHGKNLGVGGAVKTGYMKSLELKADIVVKMDGDGQMDPRYIPNLIAPVIYGKADYTKGNRFFEMSYIGTMPKIRVFGNVMLSFLTKFSSGYWSLFDPTNGFTAIHASLIQAIPWGKIDNRYFFESDILFRLGILRAVCKDVPMAAIYGEEKSNLSIINSTATFPFLHIRNLLKRVAYSYYLRDFNFASISLLLGLILLSFGFVFGGVEMWDAIQGAEQSAPGIVMLAALPVILGSQGIMWFLMFDINNQPKDIIYPDLLRVDKFGAHP